MNDVDDVKCPLLEGVERRWKRTEGWDWFGEKRWWEISVTFYGVNGNGGACVKELWRWNGSNEIVRTEIRNLTFLETVKTLKEIVDYENQACSSSRSDQISNTSGS